MEAKLKNQGEITIVTISGSLDIERTQPFREACLKHFLSKKVIFNMEQASFVGSTGLQSFIDTLKVLTSENSHGMKVVCVKSEFKRIFQNIEHQKFQVFDDEAAAIASFT